MDTIDRASAILVHGKILGGRQGHVRYQQALHGGLLGGIDEADNLVQGTGILEHVLEIQVVIVRESHAAEDDLVHIGAEGHHGHDLVVGLVRVGEEGYFLSRYEGIVQVNAGDTGGNQLRGLLPLVGVDRRASDVAALSLDLRASVDGVAVGIEKASCQLVADVEGGRLAEECHLGIGRDALGALIDLEGDQVVLDLHHLGQTPGHCGQLVVGDSLCPERHGRFGDGLELSVYPLKCFICHG